MGNTLARVLSLRTNREAGRPLRSHGAGGLATSAVVGNRNRPLAHQEPGLIIELGDAA